MLTGVLGAVAMLGLLAFALRLTFGTTRDLPVPDPDDPTVHGMLVTAGTAPTAAAAAALRARLAAAGVRATISPHPDGTYHVLVFPDDEARAKALLA